MYYIRKLYGLTRWYVDTKLIKVKDEKIINFLYNLHNFKRTFNISKLTKKKKKEEPRYHPLANKNLVSRLIPIKWN